ncbi:MAG: hypothetical protein MOGMAGMI_00077 [Candidatus Omnitrophica bacterium]|nr:hypothetical protein [Candidatus Omnitrophota bacterium]
MYTVIKEIHFCYGHRLMDYDGKCAHPHGHNGKIEIELETRDLDKHGMVYDFGDIKEIVHRWVDRELDHRMILKQGDPLIEVLRGMGEPVYVMPDNPTAECLSRLIFTHARAQGLPVRRVTFWETTSSCASYGE